MREILDERTTDDFIIARLKEARICLHNVFHPNDVRMVGLTEHLKNGASMDFIVCSNFGLQRCNRIVTLIVR